MAVSAPLSPSRTPSSSDLARQARTAIAALVLSHKERTKRIAGQFCRKNPGLDFDDVLQEAEIACIYAAKCYNPDAPGASNFIGYAATVIHRSLVRLLKRATDIQTGPLHVGNGRRGKLTVPLDDTDPNDPDRPTLIEELGDGDDDERIDSSELLREILMEIPFFPREVVIRRDGLLNQSPRSFTEIAREFGVPRKNVVKMYKDGYERMKRIGKRKRRGG